MTDDGPNLTKSGLGSRDCPNCGTIEVAKLLEKSTSHSLSNFIRIRQLTVLYLLTDICILYFLIFTRWVEEVKSEMSSGPFVPSIPEPQAAQKPDGMLSKNDLTSQPQTDQSLLQGQFVPIPEIPQVSAPNIAAPSAEMKKHQAFSSQIKSFVVSKNTRHSLTSTLAEEQNQIHRTEVSYLSSPLLYIKRHLQSFGFVSAGSKNMGNSVVAFSLWIFCCLA